MAKWSNFSIWKGRLPHWRADGVSYYITFRHRRELTEQECADLFAALVKPHGRRWEIELICVLPEKTEIVASMSEKPSGEEYELSDIVEKAKSKAGKAVIKRSGERFPPFYGESYDRIIRDEGEMAQFWESILGAPVQAGLCDEPDEYRFLWSTAAPQ